MTLKAPPVRRKSVFTLKLEEARDSTPMTVNCGLCDWSGYTGPAGQAREKARDHRRRKHPDRPLVAQRPKKPKPPPRRVEQTPEDKAIVAAIAARQTPSGQPKPPRSTLSQIELEEMYVTRQMSIRQIALEKGVWHSTVRRSLERYGISRRDGRSRSWVTPRREAVAWRLYAQGHTAQEIAELAAPLWGYTTVRQCRRSLYEQFAAHGRSVRPAKRRIAVPELDRDRALKLLEAAG